MLSSAHICKKRSRRAEECSGPWPFIAMRQQADEAGHAQPFALARRNELVEQHLRAVGEVAELRFPHRQRIRLGQRIAVLEAEHRLFGQQRVDDLVMALVAAEVIERRVAAFVLLIDQHRMALREGAALGVLAGQADVMAFLQQRTERQRLAGCPVDARRRCRSLSRGCPGTAGLCGEPGNRPAPW